MKKLPPSDLTSEMTLCEEKPEFLEGWVLKKIYVSVLPGSAFKDSLCGSCKRELNNSWICMFCRYQQSVVRENFPKVYCEDCAAMKCGEFVKVSAILYYPHWGYVEAPNPFQKETTYLPVEKKKIKTIVEL